MLNPPRPVIKQVERKEPKHLLPYEQQLAARKGEDATKPQAQPAQAPQAGEPGTAAETGPAQDAAPAQPGKQAAAEQGAPAAKAAPNQQPGQTGAASLPSEGAPNQGASPDNGANAPEQGALPPDEGAGTPQDGQGPYDVTAVPPGAPPPPYGEAPPNPRPPYASSPRDGLYSGPPQEDPYGAPVEPPYGAPPAGAYGNGEGPYGQGRNAPPYGQGAPNGQDQAGAPQPSPGAPGAPQQGAPQEEWVVVLASGAGMRATAADDAPVLFAFPYGRNLKVVSHYQNWVEVSDPKTAATGWMKDDEVSAIPPPGAMPPQTEAYDQGAPEGPGGWFRRRRGGLADIISRALGGGF